MREITFKGKQSLKDFEITAKSVSRPILPTLRKREIVIPGMHGIYDFGSSTYENRIITVLLQFVGLSIPDLRLQARNIALWISGNSYEKLTFDDEPDKYYLAKVYNAIGLDTFAKLGVCTVQFECLPFALYQVSSGEDVLLDSDLPLDSDILLNPGTDYTLNVTGNTTFDIDYIGTQEVGLGSHMGSQFDIVISGSFATLSIALNGRTLTYIGPVSNQIIIINNVDATVKQNGSNMLHNVSGNTESFLQLIPGINMATITGTGLNCSVLFDFRPQYL